MPHETDTPDWPLRPWLLAGLLGIAGFLIYTIAGDQGPDTRVAWRAALTAFLQGYQSQGVASQLSLGELWALPTTLRVVLIGSDFQVRVWQALLDIPLGRAETYSAIAARIGSPKASRAVGAEIPIAPSSSRMPA